MPFAATWMDPEMIILSEVSQTEIEMIILSEVSQTETEIIILSKLDRDRNDHTK